MKRFQFIASLFGFGFSARAEQQKPEAGLVRVTCRRNPRRNRRKLSPEQRWIRQAKRMEEKRASLWQQEREHYQRGVENGWLPLRNEPRAVVLSASVDKGE